MPVLEPLKIKSKSRLNAYHANPGAADNEGDDKTPQLSAALASKQRRLREREEIFNRQDKVAEIDKLRGSNRGANSSSTRGVTLQIKNLKAQN
jgi:hypothetical protein